MNTPTLLYMEEQITHLVTVSRLGIWVGAQGAGTHHEEEECQEGPHHSQQHCVLHATLCDGGSWPWHCKRLIKTISITLRGSQRGLYLVLHHSNIHSCYNMGQISFLAIVHAWTPLTVAGTYTLWSTHCLCSSSETAATEREITMISPNNNSSMYEIYSWGKFCHYCTQGNFGNHIINII